MSKITAKRTRKGRGFDVTVCGRLLCPAFKSRVEAKVREIATGLMGARLVNTLTIKVSVVSNAGDGARGAVWTMTHDGTRSHRAFPITIDRSLPWEQIVKTLAHELRHVEQFRRGRLQLRLWASDHKVHARWEGVELGPLDSLPYYTRPWEVEARATGEAKH